MSLITLIRHPDIRAAFDSLATKDRTPEHMRGCQLLVPDAGGLKGLAGTAFDHLARFQISRDLRDAVPKFYADEATISSVELHVEIASVRSGDLLKSIAAAKHEADAYIKRGSNLRTLADLIQYVAMAEMAFRGNAAPDPEFEPQTGVSDELVRMIEIFCPRARYAPKSLCVLNPVFELSQRVGGADADLVMDETLIDLKTTIKQRVEVEMMRQLAGYAALQSIGGIKIGSSIHATPFAAVELYYARYGITARWSMDELFPGDGFQRFCDVIREVVDTSRRR